MEAHAEGYLTKATALNAHAEGRATQATAEGAHSEGGDTRANGVRSHAEGNGTIANGKASHVEGRYNIADTVDAYGEGRYAHIVGNGTPNNRSNAHTVSWNGDGAFAGSVSSTTGADYAEYFEWQDGNPENEDRVGYVVTLNGDKIRFATAQDEGILGIISGTAAIIGDTAEYEWCNKNLTDDFGRVITERTELFIENTDPETEEVTKTSIGFFDVPKLNPEYDPTARYVGRDKRPEWACVGMFGKLYVRDDGTCQVNGYACVGDDGILTNSDVRTNIKVMKRTNDNIIRVLLK